MLIARVVECTYRKHLPMFQSDLASTIRGARRALLPILIAPCVEIESSQHPPSTYCINSTGLDVVCLEWGLHVNDHTSSSRSGMVQSSKGDINIAEDCLCFRNFAVWLRAPP